MANDMYLTKSIDEIKEAIESPKLYLISYFENIKNKIDLEYAEKLKDIADDIEARQAVSKEWTKLADIIEKCQSKCLNNTLPKEITCESTSKTKIKETKNKINSFLLSNDSYFVFELMVNSEKKLLILEEGLTGVEINALTEGFRKNSFEFKFDKIDMSKFDVFKMNRILEEITISKSHLIHMESIFNKTELIANFKPVNRRSSSSSDEIEKQYILKLDSKCFESFTQLNSLSISHINLNQLNGDTFKYLKNLKTLKLSNLKVKDFNFKGINKIDSPNDFVKLECLELRSVDSNNNILTELDNFIGLKSLKSLTLLACNINLIKKDAFVNLTNLEELNLSYNEGLQLEDGCLCCLTKLISLDLESYDCNKLDKKFFLGLSQLEKLNLNSTRIVTVEQDCFDDLTNLKWLSLECFDLNKPRDYKNRKSFLKSLDSEFIFCKLGCFKRLTKLEFLDISFCEFLFFKKNSFAGLERLEKLVSIQTSANFELGCFNGLKNLKHLDLSYSQATAIRKDIFKGLDNLEELVLNNTSFEIEAGSFDGLYQLKTLDLSICFIETLEKNVFRGLTRLETLDLSYNRLSELVLKKGCFNGLKNLKELNLSDSGIEVLERNIFNDLENLETLNLSGSHVLRNGCFNGLKKLKKLDLSDCDLSSLSRSVFVGLVSLEWLDLSGNEELNLDANFFMNLKNLKNLKLSENGFSD